MTRVTPGAGEAGATGSPSAAHPALGWAVLRAAHIGPTVAVTTMIGLLAVALGLDAGRGTTAVLAVLTGQLSIGWSNDLVDVRRDRLSGRDDKPLATGEVSSRLVRVLCGLALAATVPLSLACGLVAGVVQLGTVAAGWAYNLGLKATWWSWLPYALAFGGLPLFVALAGDPGTLPGPALPLAGALLGVGAHLVNALPDLADDEATGVRGLPHRIGARWTPRAAVLLLVLASLAAASDAPDSARAGTVAGLVVVLALAALALTSRGRTPFRAAMGIALVDVLLLAVTR